MQRLLQIPTTNVSTYNKFPRTCKYVKNVYIYLFLNQKLVFSNKIFCFFSPYNRKYKCE